VAWARSLPRKEEEEEEEEEVEGALLREGEDWG